MIMITLLIIILHAIRACGRGQSWPLALELLGEAKRGGVAGATYICISIYNNIYIYIYLYIYLSLSLYIYIYMYTYTYTYVYIYIYIYTLKYDIIYYIILYYIILCYTIVQHILLCVYHVTSCHDVLSYDLVMTF